MGALQAGPLMGARMVRLGLSALDRRAVEQQIEALIALLDDLDGDPDEEDSDEDGDPCDLGEDACCSQELPVYGIDQSKGPLNATPWC